MLALATTTARVTGRPTAPGPDTRPRDAHGALLPEADAERGPFAAHRSPFSARVRGATKTGADEQQLHLVTWYLEPAAWPVRVGDTITDDADGSDWNVSQADLVPSGLGLQQVMCACSALDVAAN